MDRTEAEQQIHRALLSYCRGIDRLDQNALLAGFHPGAALLDYGPEPMTIEVFAEHALSALEQRYRATQHRISNTMIDFDPPGDGDGAGDSALVETYVLAFHWETVAGDEADRLHTFNGRYIDRFEERDGRWLISRRTLRNDWSKVESVSRTMGGAWQSSGRAGRPDPLYTEG